MLLPFFVKAQNKKIGDTIMKVDPFGHISVYTITDTIYHQLGKTKIWYYNCYDSLRKRSARILVNSKKKKISEK